MKFVENIFNVSRIGSFVDLPARWDAVSLKTPTCLSYTRAGAIPHITYDVLPHLDRDIGYSNISLHPLPTVINFRESIKEFGNGLAKFVGLPDQPFHLSVQDPACVTKSGYNTKNYISIWSHQGRIELSSKDFMEIIKSYKPFSYQVLCDSDTLKDCSKKRQIKAVDNSLNFLDECLEEHSASEELHNTIVFGSIQGGYNLELRKKSARETAKRNVDGFIIDGFNSNPIDGKNLEFTDIKEILTEVLGILPADKPRMLNGPFSPIFILEAIKCGIDLFDSSYPYVLTESGNALNLPIDLTKTQKLKRTKFVYQLDMKDQFYADQFCPITKGCQCYTCLNYTSAYVHHLLVTAELLARTLLMIHNMHQFSKFFRCVREAIENNCFDQLEKSCDFMQI